MKFSTIAGLSLCGLLALSGCNQEEFKPVSQKGEVGEASVKLDLPPVPKFEMPKSNADGTHSVPEMRLKGHEFLETEIEVKGFVIWQYDCATAIRTPEMTEKELKRLLEEEPERCERPNIYLGQEADSPTDKGIWVVEVPRPPRKDEKKSLSKEDLAAWPEVPSFKLGDEVIVKGKWNLKSPMGFAKSEGLLIYTEMRNLTEEADGAEKEE